MPVVNTAAIRPELRTKGPDVCVASERICSLKSDSGDIQSAPLSLRYFHGMIAVNALEQSTRFAIHLRQSPCAGASNTLIVFPPKWDDEEFENVLENGKKAIWFHVTPFVLKASQQGNR